MRDRSHDDFGTEGTERMELGPRARLTWCAHLIKACVRHHHLELRPALTRLIRSDSVIFDVGSHAGQFAKLFARMAPRGQVYAFEPGSYALSILRPAIRFNRLGNIIVMPYGLGDEPGEQRLTVPVKSSGSLGFGLGHVATREANSVGRSPAEPLFKEEAIDMSTIDRVVAEQGIDRVDFIKADIEGWEMRMLAGAMDTIVRDRPSMMIEVVDEHLTRAGDSAAALFEYLADRGYRAYGLDTGLSRFHPLTGPDAHDIFFVDRENDPLAE